MNLTPALACLFAEVTCRHHRTWSQIAQRNLFRQRYGPTLEKESEEVLNNSFRPLRIRLI
jgi:hypothetical protein